MNGLMVPTGGRAPIKGDTRSDANAALTLSTSPQSPSSSQHSAAASGYGGTAAQTAQPSALSTSPYHATRTGPGLKSAASLAFIPRTSRTSAGIRKPLSRCSEFELADMLDRHERILATPLPFVSGQENATPSVHARLQDRARARERLRIETDEIRKELLVKRGVRQIQDDVGRWRIDDKVAPQATSREALAEAMDRLSVQAALPTTSSSSTARASDRTPVPRDSLAWERDTLGVKKRLAEEMQNTIPGSRVQQMSYEQSLALQSAALLAEMERVRRSEEARSISTRERTANSLPAGPAHRLGRKSISSASTALRKGTGGSPVFHGGGGKFGPCPGFGLPRRPSATGTASAAVLSEDNLPTVKTEDVDENDEDEDLDDEEDRRRTVSPSDVFDDGFDPEGRGHDVEEMAFEDDFE